MDMRLMKISILYERLPRLIRDLAAKSQKKISLSLLGEDFEVDRKVVEHLFEPMLHLIRNAVDHGIELPQQRVRRGKAEVRVITGKSFQEGCLAIIDVIDDGKGLDIEGVKRGVLSKGFYSAETLGGMSTEEIASCIFLPGYTTTTKATQVSGRGVGLDVVKNNIQAIGGGIQLTYKPDQGMRFSMRVPLTMALEDVLLVESDGELYAFPFAAMKESIVVQRRDIEVLQAREFIHYRDMVIPIRHLSGAIEAIAPQKLRKINGQELAVIILAFGGRHQGVVVDRVLRREPVLIKPLDKHFGKIREIRGAALMGDGSIVFIIDPIGLFS
jgi:two-component system chemotaxis sensor kinase CheA